MSAMWSSRSCRYTVSPATLAHRIWSVQPFHPPPLHTTRLHDWKRRGCNCPNHLIHLDQRTSSMDPTSRKHHGRPSRPDPIPSSSLQRPTSKHPRAHLPGSHDSKAFAPVKGAAPPRVDTTLQAKAMALSLNAGPSITSKKQQQHRPQPKKHIPAAAMAHKPSRLPIGIDCGEKEEGAEEDEKRLVVFGDGRRKSFCGPEIDVNQILAGVRAKVVAEDMAPFMQIHAVTCARKTCDGLDKFSSKALAFTLKKEFDKVYGPAWHCIVGTSFGSFVTHSVGGFIYFSMDKMYILLFKTAVQRAD